jgi:hypothetical protein
MTRLDYMRLPKPLRKDVREWMRRNGKDPSTDTLQGVPSPYENELELDKSEESTEPEEKFEQDLDSEDYDADLLDPDPFENYDDVDFSKY